MSTAPVFAAISYSLSGAVAATSIGETRIKEAIANNDLPAHYNGARLVIRAADLDEWVQSLPTERIGKAGF